MGEDIAETYYRVTPECPCCDVELRGNAEPIDMFRNISNDDIHHILDCDGCETRLELVIHHENPRVVELWVTPVDEELT